MIHKYLDNGEAPSPSAGMEDLSDAGTAEFGRQLGQGVL